MNCQIKLASLADARLYCEHLIRFASENGRDGIYFSPYSASYPRDVFDLEKRVRERWEKPTIEPGCERSLVAVVDSKIIGHLDLQRDLLWPSSHRLELSMGLEYDYKQRGLGSRLMKQAIEFASVFEGARWIDLGVFKGNAPALALYSKFGFVQTGFIVDKFRTDGSSIDDIQMTLKLPK